MFYILKEKLKFCHHLLTCFRPTLLSFFGEYKHFMQLIWIMTWAFKKKKKRSTIWLVFWIIFELDFFSELLDAVTKMVLKWTFLTGFLVEQSIHLILLLSVFARQIRLTNRLSTFSPQKPSEAKMASLKWLPLDFRVPQNNHKSHCENEALENVQRKMSFCVILDCADGL